MTPCLVLYSGGIDSTTALFWAIKRFTQVTAVTFDYGQRHGVEVELAQKLSQRINIPHKILILDLRQIGGSALTDSAVPLPEFETIEDMEPGPPATYVPFRNGILLSLAAAWGETQGHKEIVCGFNVIDSPDYPDTRESFVSAMEQAINEGTKSAFTKDGFTIHTPFIRMKKSDIIRQGLDMGADYSYSISCYSGQEIPCLKCSSCLLRQNAWEETGKKDHLLVRLEREGKI